MYTKRKIFCNNLALTMDYKYGTIHTYVYYLMAVHAVHLYRESIFNTRLI